MLTRGPRCVTTGSGCPWTAMPRTSCPPTSLALPADHASSLGAGRYLLTPRVKHLATTPRGVLRRRGESERRDRTTSPAIVAAAQNGTSGVLACGKQARHQTMRDTPRTGGRGHLSCSPTWPPGTPLPRLAAMCRMSSSARSRSGDTDCSQCSNDWKRRK